MRGGAVVARQPHKLEVAGSTPARASSVIPVTCDPTGRLRRMEVGEANRFQGALKSLAPEQYAKARPSILDKGFFAPLFLWTHLPDGTEIDCPMILDGHQREHVVRTEGWQLEGGGYPVVEIVAADEKDAAEKVLLLLSTYGKIEPQGLYDFTQAHGIELPEFDLAELPDIDMAAFIEEFHEIPTVPLDGGEDGEDGEDNGEETIELVLHAKASKVTAQLLDEIHKFAQSNGLRFVTDDASRPDRRYWGSWKKGDVVKPQ